MLVSLWLVSLVAIEGDFKASEEAWRSHRLERLKAEDGWLNLIGLFWLEEGPNRLGTDATSEIVLPRHSTVPHAGTIHVADGQVTYQMERAQLAMLDGKVAASGSLTLGPPASVLAHNNLRFFLIERDERLALRVRDLRSKAVTEFKGISYYKPKKKYVIEAQFTPFDRPEVLWVATVIDTQEMKEVPGKLTFELDENSYELFPFLEKDGDVERLFIIYKDTTSGNETYPSGRYLYADLPSEEGAPVILNFNRAYNPPCAFTDFATCPLPPADNWLDVAIEAGEKYNGEGH